MKNTIKFIFSITIPGFSWTLKGRNKLGILVPIIILVWLIFFCFSRIIVTASGFVLCIFGLLLIHFGSMIMGYLHKNLFATPQKHRFINYIFLITINIAIAQLFFHKNTLLGLEVYYIPSNSMSPTLKQGDIVIADTWIDSEKIAVGDIIIFEHPEIPKANIIKRVSSLKKNSVYVLGDSPNNSLDSRLLGDIEKEAIKGKAKILIRNAYIQSL